MKWLIFPFFFLAFQTWAQSSVIDGILVEAESTEGDTVNNRFLLKGNVRVAFKGQSISCDQAFVDLNSKTVDASGSVVVDDPRAHVEADRVQLNYHTNLGTIYNGFVQSGQVVIVGAKIQKTGENTYLAETAEFTSCATCPPGWAFSGRLIEAELEGYAKIRRPILKLGGWSVLPLPYLVVPLKTKRQSGLLVPSYEYSQRGKLAISDEYFWAISRSQDATLKATWHELLGFKFDTEYRYVLDENSQGGLTAGFINDRAFQNEMTPSYPGTSPLRWYMKYQHQFELPNNYVQRVEWADVSDLSYPRDFSEDVNARGAPAIENRISITKNSDWLHTSAEASVFKNLLKAYPLAENSDAVHKIPEIRISSVSQKLWTDGPSMKFNVNSTHFVRDRMSYDDLTLNNLNERVPTEAGGSEPGEFHRDGKFDRETDLLRTGHRLIASSTVSYPFHLGRAFEILPQVSYREMQYRFQLDPKDGADSLPPTAAQRFVQTDIRAQTQFSRVFGKDGEFKNKYKHLILPEVSYSNIPWIRRPHHDFFGAFEDQQFNRSAEPISDQDLNGINKVQFDYEDRIFDRDFVTLALTNEITRKTFQDGEPVYKRLLYLRFSQSYDYNEAQTDRPQPWSNINGQLRLSLDNFSASSTTAYNPHAKITNTSSSFRFSPQSSNFFEVSYSQYTQVDENNEVEPNTENRNIGWGLGLNSKYLNLSARVDHSSVTGKIQSWQYVSQIKPPGNCWYILFHHEQYLQGETKFKANISFNFDGEGDS